MAIHYDLLKTLDPVTMDATSRPQCLAGTRTEILRSLAQNLAAPSPEANNCFAVAASSGRSSSLTGILQPETIRTLAYQLALSSDILNDAICDAIARDLQIATRPLRSQFTELLLTPLQIGSPRMRTPMIIILDALDECGDAYSRRALLHLLSEQLPLLPHHVRFLITGRPELDLNNTFCSRPGVKSMSLNASERSSKADVLLYIQHELTELRRTRQSSDELPQNWPGTARVQQLGERASDSFIWAATAMKYLHTSDDLQDGLDRLLNQTTFTLDDLYATALRSAIDWGTNGIFAESCRKILGAAVVGRIALTDDLIVELLGLRDSRSCRVVLRRLACLLQWSEGLPVRTLHASFADYLVDPDRCGNEPWFVDRAQCHLEFAVGCLRTMEARLCFNICGLETSHAMNRDIPDLAKRVANSISRVLAYSCRFWAEHLSHAGAAYQHLHPQILGFFQNRFLHWLEVLSLTGEGRAALSSMNLVKSLCKNYPGDLQTFAIDGAKFSRAFASVIADSAPHIYVSALAFAPSRSIIKNQYASTFPGTLRVQAGANMYWPSCELIIGHPDEIVSSVAFSPNGEQFASFAFQFIYIWDAQTGEQILQLDEKQFEDGDDGYNDNVEAVAYSPDGKRIVSGSWRGTVFIWNAQTGALLGRPFQGHNYGLNSVVFSPDGERIMSCSSDDHNISIWRVSPCTLVTEISWGSTADVINSPGGSKPSLSVALFLDGNRVLSCSSRDGIHVWDAWTGKLIIGPFGGRPDLICSVAVSPDGERIVSGSEDKTIRVWNARTAELVAGPFVEHLHRVSSVAVSLDGKYIASGSADKTIRILSLQTGELISGPFTGHAGPVCSVIFSPDGERVVSGSDDGTIRIWSTWTSKVAAKPYEGHNESVLLAQFSPDDQQIVSGSRDGAICTWNAWTGELISKVFTKVDSEEVARMAFSPDGLHVAIGSADGLMSLWDIEKAELIGGPLKVYKKWLWSLSFSPDGGRIVSSGMDEKNYSTTKIWNARTFEADAKFDGASNATFSPDGRRIAAVSGERIYVWDVEKGSLALPPIIYPRASCSSVEFSPSGDYIVTCSDGRVIGICICDVRTGEGFVFGILGEDTRRAERYSSVCFSPDGDRVVSVSWGGIACVWDVWTCELVAGPFEGHIKDVGIVMTTERADSVAYSSSGRRIVTGSWDETIRVIDLDLDARCQLRSGYCSTSQLKDGWMQNSPTELLFWGRKQKLGARPGSSENHIKFLDVAGDVSPFNSRRYRQLK
ncbi:hypothetical protein HWV62_29112 [Athelia sp. TMB]|nr:hypothetical protein HWV62_29112 [Athelia sp. TMB]